MSSSQETAADSPIWLFKTRLCSREVNINLSQLVLKECSEAMKEVLAAQVKKRGTCRYVRVMTTDPNKEYELRLMDYTGEGNSGSGSCRRYVLVIEWGSIVTANGLKIGDIVEGWGNVVGYDGGGEIYFTCKLHIGRQRDLPSSGNQGPGHKRGDHGDKRKTLAKGDDVKNPKKKENPAEGCSERKYSSSSEKSKSVGGNEEIDAGVIPSERKRVISSPAIQESEQVDVEDIADGENPEMKKGLTNPRERKKAISPFEKELDYADMELVIKECNNALGNASSHGTLKVLLYFLRKLVKNVDEKNFDEEMKLAMDQVKKKIVEIMRRMEERV